MFSAIVLAGGKSQRMGKDKRHLLFQGKSLLEISVNRLRNIADEIIVVTGEEENLDNRDVHFVVDIEKDRGPMIGLVSGLSKIKNPYGIVTPVDCPLIPHEFLSYLKEKAVSYDLTVPRWKRGIEPLIAVYSKSIIPVMNEWVKKEEKLAPHLFIQKPDLKVRFIEEDEISNFGIPEILFLNINTEIDLRKAELLMGEKAML
jgi:molybdopterin-guanine dinucleotide biosynthesis protein A